MQSEKKNENNLETCENFSQPKILVGIDGGWGWIVVFSSFMIFGTGKCSIWIKIKNEPIRSLVILFFNGQRS